MQASYVDHMGTDLSVVNAARVSFDKTSEWDKTGPIGILNVTHPYETYSHVEHTELAKHNHWTPFAHNSITLRMQAPVPIRTQC